MLKTITLTKANPVVIETDYWQIISSTSENISYKNGTSKWFLAVRQHEDGRAIVYATYSRSDSDSKRSIFHKRGIVISPQKDIAEAIYEVSGQMEECRHFDTDGSMWSELAATCCAGLPIISLD
jgi:hypothetical protein